MEFFGVVAGEEVFESCLDISQTAVASAGCTIEWRTRCITGAYQGLKPSALRTCVISAVLRRVNV
jgi:hypothetical protein